MKIREITFVDPLNTEAIIQYSTDNNFELYRFSSVGQFLDLPELLGDAVDQAVRKKCTQYSIRQVRQDYNVHDDTITWWLEIYGFRKNVMMNN